MYEILEVSPTASLEEIKAAHKRLSIRIMSGKLGLSREDCEFKLKVLDVALHTLSATALRDAYDAELAATAAGAAPGNVVVPYKANAVLPGGEARALQLLAEVQDTYKVAPASLETHRTAIKVISSTVSTSAKSLKIVLRGVIGLLVLGSILSVGKISFSSRQGVPPSKEVAKAEEKLIILEYYKKYGVRPASRAEAEFLETENRRKENEQRATEFAEKRREDEYRRFVEDSRRMGESVHNDIVQDEAQEMRRQRELEEERRFQEEAAKEDERIRIENERQKYRIN